jgi:TolB-like protein/class 3 adenylate cyclase
MVQERPVRLERRLAAILAADVAGYSRLMHHDEETTHVELSALLADSIMPAISEHGGRIVKNTGDGFLAEFPSAVEAVRAAVQFQTRITELTDSDAEDTRIAFRVGINVGDVIVEPHDIFGDGVNIAARLESIAEPGGICISHAAYDHVRGKIGVEFADLGDQNLKNFTRPVQAFAVVWDAPSPARKAGGARSDAPDSRAQSSRLPLALSDKPSIAVLPFQNMSGDREQDHFADGIVEDIITALSRFKSLFVIARHSSFTYKGKVVDIKQVGRELGVRYILEGSVRKAGARVRISGQLIDVGTSAHLWADRFDGALEDLFDLQDQITQQVIGAIAPEVDRAEMERARRRAANNIDAVTAYYRGLPHLYFPTTAENNDAALIDFRTAMALDPSFAPAYGGVASCLAWRRANKWPSDNAQDNAELLHLAERLKELGTDDAFSLSYVGFNLFWINLEFDAGTELIERAIRSNANFVPALNGRGLIRGWHGESDAAVADLEQSMRLSPRDPQIYNAMLGLALAHHNGHRHAEAAEWTDRAIRAFPRSFHVGRIQSILVYVGAGRLEDARRLMAECLRRNRGMRRSTHTAPHYRSPKLKAELLDALIVAGLPD